MSPATREFLSLLGFVFLEHRQAHKAVIIFEALQADSPSDVKTSSRLAYAYLVAGRPGDALCQAEKHLDTFPTDPDLATIRQIRGRALWLLNRRDEARRSIALNGNGKRHA